MGMSTQNQIHLATNDIFMVFSDFVSTIEFILIFCLWSDNIARLPLQARPPAKPARHSPEAQPMADGQGEAGRRYIKS